MSMLSVRLDDEDETKLVQILAKIKVTKSDLVKQLINEQWVALQMGRTFLERRGSHPTYTLSGAGTASERATRKKQLSAHYEQRKTRRKSS